MNSKRTQAEWLNLARTKADELYDKQVELFGDLTDVVYFCTTTDRFDDFVKLSLSVAPKSYEKNNENAKKVDKYCDRISEWLYLTHNTEDGELDAFYGETLAKMTRYANTIRNIINDK